MVYEVGPYSAEHVYIQWGGSLPGNEVFSCGLRMQSTGTYAGLLADLDNAVTDNMADIVVQYHQDPQALITGHAVLEFVKVNVIGLDGKYKFSSTHEKTYVGAPGGGGSTIVYPNQTALAVSFVTGVKRGPAHRGRVYLPFPNTTIQPDGMITAGDASSVRLATQGFLDTLNNNAGPFQAAVFSRKKNAPTSRPITGCEVGRVLDTQRRRRNGLPESYVIGS